MSVQEALRAGVCRQLVEGKLSEAEAGARLSLSVREVGRYKKRLQAEGESGVVHRLRVRRSLRRIGEERREEVVRLYRETYSGWWRITGFNDGLLRRRRAEVRGFALGVLGRPARPTPCPCG